MALTPGTEPSIEIISPKKPAAPVAKPVEPADLAKKKFRQRWWSVGITMTIVLIGLATWYFDVYGKLSDLYNTTSATVRVKEDNTYALAGATVEVGGQTFVTDDTGKAGIARIVAGTYLLKVTKEGYESVEEEWTLVRGDNEPKSISLSKQKEPRYAISGVVLDYVSDKPLPEVLVSIGGASVRTNPAGEFVITDLPGGEHSVTFSKTGFITKQTSLTAEENASTASIILVPNGQVVFTTNRDGGKRHIYAADYDGENQRRLIPEVNGQEDFAPLLSPDGRYLAFVSDRDKYRDAAGKYALRLYVASRDGGNVRKVGDEIGPVAATWSPDGRYLFYTAAPDERYSRYLSFVANVETGTVFRLEAVPEKLVFAPSGDIVYYALALAAEDESGARFRFVRLNVRTGERTQLADVSAPDMHLLAYLMLSLDAKSLLYGLQPVGQAAFSYRMDAASGAGMAAPEPLPAERWTFVTSPDGTQQVFTAERDGQRNLFLLTADGAERQITSAGGVLAQPAMQWDSSGSYVVVAAQSGSERALYVTHVRDGGLKKVVNYYESVDGFGRPYPYPH